jgi:hypothetical protein
MRESIDRREFLKLAGLGGAGVDAEVQKAEYEITEYPVKKA